MLVPILVITLLAAPKAAVAPLPTPNRFAGFVVPMDQGALEAWIQVMVHVDETLAARPDLVVRKSEAMLGMPTPPEASAALVKAEASLKIGKQAFFGGEMAGAARALAASAEEHSKASAALNSCSSLCEALAYLTSAQFKLGKPEEARTTLATLLAYSPEYDFEKSKHSKEFVTWLRDTQPGLKIRLTGRMLVTSQPAGSQIYLDGNAAGFTPKEFDSLRLGKHWIRVERPGYQREGKMVEVTGDEEDMRFVLKATPAQKSLEAQADRLAAEVLRDRGGEAMAWTGKTFGLDRALIATLKRLNDGGTLELMGGIYDLKTGRRYSAKKVLFQGDEWGQLKQEVSHWVNVLINEPFGMFDKKSLETHSGMEDWGTGPKPIEPVTKKPKKKIDPLDTRSGTEDW